MPPIPDPPAIAALSLTLLALVLFTRERVPLEASALFILLLVALASHLFPLERGGETLDPRAVFSGFGNQALIAIVCLMLCAKGLEETGALSGVGNLLARIWMKQPKLALLLTLLVAAAFSMFMNNTPIVAMLLPLLVSVSMRTGIDASKILMPVGYATIIGGMATTIGTSTNLLVVGIAADLGMRSLNMFDFAPVAAFAAVVSFPFLWLVAPKLLPARSLPMKDTSPRIFHGVLHIGEESKATDKTLAEVLAMTNGQMQIRQVERGEGLYVARLPTLTLREGDRLHTRDTRENLKEFEQLLGATLYAPGDGQPIEETSSFKADDEQLAEVVITASSPLNGRKLSEIRLLASRQLTAVALHRPRAGDRQVSLKEGRLQPADVVLIQGPSEEIRELKNTGYLMVLDGSLTLPTAHRSERAIAIMLGVVVATALGWLPISVSAALGAGAMLLTGCLKWERAGAALDVKIILLIVAALALGRCLSTSGAAAYLAELFVFASGSLSVALQISLLMLSMALLTELVTNNAAAVIGTPIAMSIGVSLGLDPEPFVLAVLFGGNMSFMTPMGYQTNLLVMSAGGYKFTDFPRVGLPLQILAWLALSYGLVFIYDL